MRSVYGNKPTFIKDKEANLETLEEILGKSKAKFVYAYFNNE